MKKRSRRISFGCAHALRRHIAHLPAKCATVRNACSDLAFSFFVASILLSNIVPSWTNYLFVDSVACAALCFAVCWHINSHSRTCDHQTCCNCDTCDNRFHMFSPFYDQKTYKDAEVSPPLVILNNSAQFAYQLF